MRCSSRVFAAFAGVVLISSATFAQNVRREAGAHVHGAGKLGIVIDENTVSLDLDTPAHDILGFEHAPETVEHTRVLEEAVATFKDAGKVFRMTPAAQCTVTRAEAGLEKPEPAEAGKTAAPETNGGHADFSGNFEFTCRAIDKLTGIDLGYFAAFPEATKLVTTLITPRGQMAGEVTKAAPRIDLTR